MLATTLASVASVAPCFCLLARAVGSKPGKRGLAGFCRGVLTAHPMNSGIVIHHIIRFVLPDPRIPANVPMGTRADGG